mgnify:CR=1 FL=1
MVSLPYHHPLMVANRMVLLDHLTRGRVILGVGPGALEVRYVRGAGLDQPLRIKDMIPKADYRGVYDGGSTVVGTAITNVDYPGDGRASFGDEGAPRTANLCEPPAGAGGPERAPVPAEPVL